MALLIYGRNSVRSALKSHTATKIYVTDNFVDKDILALANEMSLAIVHKHPHELTKLVNSDHHQGVIAEVKDYEYHPLSELIEDGKKVKNPIIIMLDGINDPHNLGAILRIADAFNVVGVIIKKDGQVPLNATVAKVSTGAINYVKVSEVANLNNTLIKLKEAGYWSVATDGEAKTSYAKVDYQMPIVLIIGSEGSGISSLVKKNSDFLVKIPMFGHVNSLNASNALSVVLAHIINSRISS